MIATGNPKQDVYASIDRSKSHTEIVSIDVSPSGVDSSAYQRLLSDECEGECGIEGGHEYWGIDIDGVEWRVHLVGITR